MATPHISCEPGDIAPLVLMPGDPKRAEKIANDVLDDARLVSSVRGILAFTGTYKGVPMTVMASGMGLPSISIYATELYRFYGVERIVRVGTCGAYQDDVKVRDVIIASSAHTDSSVPQIIAPGITLALAPSYKLLRGAADAAEKVEGTNVHIGPVFASDHFYLARPEVTAKLEQLGTLAVEMEASGLYSVALIEHKEALVVLTVSDHLKEHSGDLTAEERETLYHSMTVIAADALIS